MGVLGFISTPAVPGSSISSSTVRGTSAPTAPREPECYSIDVKGEADGDSSWNGTGREDHRGGVSEGCSSDDGDDQDDSADEQRQRRLQQRWRR